MTSLRHQGPGPSYVNCHTETPRSRGVKPTSKAALQRREKVSREDAVKKLTAMLEALIEKAVKEKLALAPFIGIGCPGIIN